MGGKEQNHNRSGYRIENRIFQKQRKIKFIPGCDVILQSPLLRKGQEMIDNLRIPFEGVHKNKDEGHKPKERQNYGNGENTLAKNRFFHISTSHFFLSWNSTPVIQSTTATKKRDFAVASP